MKQSKWNDAYSENIVANLLHYGVIAAEVIVSFGLVFLLLQNGLHITTPNFQVFALHKDSLNSFESIYKALLSGNPQAIIELGILALIATPIVRVAFTIFSYAKQNDKVYSAISAIVLVILMISILRAF